MSHRVPATKDMRVGNNPLKAKLPHRMVRRSNRSVTHTHLPGNQVNRFNTSTFPHEARHTRHKGSTATHHNSIGGMHYASSDLFWHFKLPWLA